MLKQWQYLFFYLKVVKLLTQANLRNIILSQRSQMESMQAE